MKRRNKKIWKLYKSGKTFKELGKLFGFTQTRAREIIVKELKKDILNRFGLKDLSAEERELLDIAVKEEIREIVLKRKHKYQRS